MNAITSTPKEHAPILPADVQSDFFGKRCSWQEGGRTGCARAGTHSPLSNLCQGAGTLERQRSVQERRGYVPRSCPMDP